MSVQDGKKGKVQKRGLHGS